MLRKNTGICSIFACVIGPDCYGLPQKIDHIIYLPRKMEVIKWDSISGLRDVHSLEISDGYTRHIYHTKHTYSPEMPGYVCL